MKRSNWPKQFPPLTAEQEKIRNDFMQYWHEVLTSSQQFTWLEHFNHQYPIKHAPTKFIRTLEIGAGIGSHLKYEKLTPEQAANYVALELRENMAAAIKKNFPNVSTCICDCQTRLPFADNYFDRIIAIHVLEHLPNLPAAIKEVHRLCHKTQGVFSVVIPCEGGALYSLARKLSAERIFEKRYQQSYDWFIKREHINLPSEIIEEIERYFILRHQSFFPFYLPVVGMNLCIGLTWFPKQSH